MALPKPKPNGSKEQSLSELIQSLAREASRTQLSGFCHNEEVTIRELRLTEDYNQEHWIVAILVSAKALNISFRTHFSNETARTIAARGLNLAHDKVSLEVARDYISEFCNLTAGMIRRTLQQAEIIEGDLTLSLPVQEKVASFALGGGEQDIIDCWAMNVIGCELICAANLRIFDWEKLKLLENKKLATMIVSDEGAINFL